MFLDFILNLVIKCRTLGELRSVDILGIVINIAGFITTLEKGVGTIRGHL